MTTPNDPDECSLANPHLAHLWFDEDGASRGCSGHGYSTAHLNLQPSGEQAAPNFLIMAARPADPNDFPEQTRPALMQLPPLEPGWIESQCQGCGMTVHLGPRQRTQLELDPEHFIVLDFICALQASQGGNVGITTIESLGGK